jgi:hypothetical protein
MLNFGWLERGGPPPQQPKSVGFGTTILRMAGDVTIEYKTPGLAYRLSVPFDEVVRSVGE